MDKGYEVVEVCNIGDNSKLKFIRIQPSEILDDRYNLSVDYKMLPTELVSALTS